MNFLLAYGIYLVVTAITWAVGLAVYAACVGEPDPRKNPQFWLASALVVAVVAALLLACFPGGYFLSLAIWWYTAKGLFDLPLNKAALLFGILAALTFVAQLAVFGALTL